MENIRIYGSDKKKIEAVSDIFEEDAEDTIHDFLDKCWEEYLQMTLDPDCLEMYNKKTERKSVWTD